MVILLTYEIPQVKIECANSTNDLSPHPSDVCLFVWVSKFIMDDYYFLLRWICADPHACLLVCTGTHPHEQVSACLAKF